MDLSGNSTVNGLWYAYLGIMMSVPICRMNSCSMPQHCLEWPTFVDLGLYYWLHIILQIPACASTSIVTWRGGSPRRTSIEAVGAILITRDSQTGLFSDIVTYKANFTNHQFLWLLIRVRDKSVSTIIPQPELGVEDLFLKMREIFCFYYCDFIFLFQSW